MLLTAGGVLHSVSHHVPVPSEGIPHELASPRTLMSIHGADLLCLLSNSPIVNIVNNLFSPAFQHEPQPMLVEKLERADIASICDSSEASMPSYKGYLKLAGLFFS